jgi:hypothetical protein
MVLVQHFISFYGYLAVLLLLTNRLLAAQPAPPAGPAFKGPGEQRRTV